MKRVDSVISGTKVEPRPYQRRIVNNAINMYLGEHRNGAGDLEPSARSVLIESPTGSGKTVMALLACKTMQSQHNNLVVGWVAMRRNLLAQAARENLEKKIGVSDIHFISMFDKNPEPVLNAHRDGKDVMLVIDEAQHDAAASCAHIHNLVKPKYILGMTATPFRADRMKLCFDKVIKDAGIHQLIQDKFLSQYDHYTIDNWNPETVADHFCREQERWGKSIFYFVNLDQCFALHEIFKDRGVVSDVVTGSSDWEEQLRVFEETDMPCLINCMKLTEGFDYPALQTAWVRDSIRSCTMQMGGRVFRKFPSLPVKQIVQSQQTRWPFIRTALPRQQYVWQGDEWRSLTVNPRLAAINQNARLAIANADVQLPKFLLDRQKKKSVRVSF